MEQTKIDIVIPVYKPGSEFSDLIKRLMHQTVVPEHIFIMQTIRDESEIMVQSMDERIRIIPVMQSEFDHGGTRALGMDKSTAEYVLMMTKVAADEHLIENLLACMEDTSVAVAYARQLARPNSGRVERMTRIYNYPAQSRIKSEDDKKELGVKTYFCSDVCALYRKAYYEQVGGFVQPTIFNEDMIIAYMLHISQRQKWCILMITRAGSSSPETLILAYLISSMRRCLRRCLRKKRVQDMQRRP